jgi:subtilisin family serine protease
LPAAQGWADTLLGILEGTTMLARPELARPRYYLTTSLVLAFLAIAENLGSAPAPLAAPASVDEALVRQRAECLRKLGVDRWHAMGWRGQDCKIAILDSGFRGYRDFLGKGLPAQVLAKSFRKDSNLEARDSQHGILCAEVIHSLAPAAPLLLANWEPDNPISFLDAVAWAKAAGARIVTCSLIMPNWSDGEGGGQVHDALAHVIGSGQSPDDMLFFASAGNTALRHWTGAFHADAQGFHQWGPGRTTNIVRPWGAERVAIEVYGPTKTCCELQVTEEGTGRLVGKMAIQADVVLNWGQAVVRFDPQPGRDYLIRLRCRPPSDGVAPNRGEMFHLVALGANLEDYTSAGSIPFPGDGANVIAVGAVDQLGQRLSYSSCGPNSSRPKPDFVGLVPFPSLCRSRPFAGTSAAAPQAAALAALCMSRYSHWTPRQVRDALQRSALDLCAPGHDCETGYGLIRLP